MSDNLPEQLYVPGTAVGPVAPAQSDDPYDIGASSILLPRLRFMQLSSTAVESGAATYGAIAVTFSKDDADPTIVAEATKKGTPTEPVTFHVLRVDQGWSYTDPNKKLGRSGKRYPDLGLVLNGDPRNVKQTHDFTLTLPAFPLMPVKFIMHGMWGGQAAKVISTRLALAKQAGLDPASVAFQIRADKTENDNGAFAQALVNTVDLAKKDLEKNLALIAEHRSLLGSGRVMGDVDDLDAEPQAAPVDAPSLA
jgi:hypothetical protein